MQTTLAPAPTIPDIAEDVHAMEIDDVVKELVGVVGRPVVALIANVADTKLVRDWSRGDVKPQRARQLTLKTALQVIRVLQSRYTKGPIITWLSGINPRLDKDSPIEVFARMSEDYKEADARLISNAAIAFANR